MEIYDDDKKFWTLEAAGSCTKCHYVLPPLKESAPAYFKAGFFTCENCSHEVDLWEASLGRSTAMSPTPWSLSSLGATHTSVIKEMKTGRYYEVDIQEFGAPADAKILAVSYTGQGGTEGSLTAIEWRGNATARRIEGTILRLMAIPLGEGKEPRVGNVAISIVWIRGEDSDAWTYLVNAFEAASARQYSSSLVMAQSAVEIALMPTVAARFRRHASSDNVKRLMNDALTYGHVMNVILPYFCAELKLPKMPAKIQTTLNKLRKTRNAIIHEGIRDAEIAPSDAAEGLCAAVFRFEFVRYIAPTLAE